MTDVGDKEIVQKVQKKHKIKRDAEKEDLRALLRSPQGRAVLWRILSYCGVYSDNPFPDLPGAMARHEGKRHIGLWLIREIHDADPHAYARIRDEAVSNEGVNND